MQSALMLKRLRLSAERKRKSKIARHADAVSVLIDFGVFESALLDSLFPRADGNSGLVRLLRKTAILAGAMLYLSWKSWERRTERTELLLQDYLENLGRIASSDLPESIRIRLPEGYIHYGLYPENYCEAARNFAREFKPEKATCIGIRSIGTSLSAAVAAVLEQGKCDVLSFTVRPHGHPFRRYVRLENGLEETILSRMDSYFLIIDEGPGLSGSSFGSVAEKLASIGIADERIIIFPGWKPDGLSFISTESAERWQKHRKFAGEFDRLWVDSKRLIDESCCRDMQDISAGKWRKLFLGDPVSYPAIHPWHERRKYLAQYTTESKDRVENRKVIIKFAGLGRYGLTKFRRARRLAQAGFGPHVHGISNGFLVFDFVNGSPLDQNDLNAELISEIARYCAFLKKEFRTSRRIEMNKLTAMMRNNIGLGLGEEWVGKLDSAGIHRRLPKQGRAVMPDCRMFPHEWLKTRSGYIKTDSVDHCSDIFFPGCTDIAWDLAGAIVEFKMGKRQKGSLLGIYSKLSNDGTIKSRISYFMIAYLAFRLGYCVFAARELEGSPDGEKFNAAVRKYKQLLKKEINCL